MDHTPEELAVESVAISMGYRCTQTPRCSFCYEAGKKPGREDMYAVMRAAQKYPNATWCFEYSGYNLRWLRKFWRYGTQPDVRTVTTMPSAVNKNLGAYFAGCGISAVALSYDREKCADPEEWVVAADLLRASGLRVSCNYLLDGGFFPILNFYGHVDQVNLLSRKPDGRLSPAMRKYVEILVLGLKNVGLPVALDNCLGVQLGHTDRCHQNTRFVHVRPDGSVVGCSFGDQCYLNSEPVITGDKEAT